MKNIRVAARHYQIMLENQKRAQEECKRMPNLKNIKDETIASKVLWAFQLGLECAGILEKVEKEWRNHYESN